MTVHHKVCIDGIAYVGNHGAEYMDNGQLTIAPAVEGYGEKIDRVLTRLRESVDSPDIVWDYKKYSLAVHYRQTERPDQVKLELQKVWDTLQDADGLDLFWGKMVMEVRPPVGIDKGYAVERLVRERRLDSAIMLGDDMTDLDAFRAARNLRGTQGAAILVLHDDTTQVLMESSDYSLIGVEEVETFLEWLVAVTDGPFDD